MTQVSFLRIAVAISMSPSAAQDPLALARRHRLSQRKQLRKYIHRLNLEKRADVHRRVTHTHTQTHPHQHRRSAHCTSTVAATHKTPRECGGGGSHRLRLHSRSWFSARRGDVRCGDALRVERVILHTNCTQTVPYGYPSPAVAVCTVPSGSGPRRSFGNTHYATHYGKDWCMRRLQAQVAA